MSSAQLSSAELTAAVKQRAHELGFELTGITTAVRPDGFDRLREWLAHGFAGEMHYLPRRESAYEHPQAVLPPVRSVIMVGMNYHTTPPPRDASATIGRLDDSEAMMADPDHEPNGRIASYAWGTRDYHDVLRERLRELSDVLHDRRPGCRTRICVDTAPLLERDFAKLAGLGWFGKNTMLINKRIGSYFFLAALLTDIELVPDEPHHTSHCGTCTRCLEACPTQAFVEPYVLDARRCISYLTIELRDEPVPLELRPLMGQWVFGCDICQDVCPWNRRAPMSTEPSFGPRERLQPTDLRWLLSLDEAGFQREFAGTPMERTGRGAMLRNVAIVLGNTRDASTRPNLESAAKDADPLLREAAEWALRAVTSATTG